MTKATEMIRRFDDLGRIVVPKEIRDRFGMSIGVPVEIYVDSKGVYLRRYRYTDSVLDVVDELEGCLQREKDLKHRTELLKKLEDMRKILEEESQ